MTRENVVLGQKSKDTASRVRFLTCCVSLMILGPVCGIVLIITIWKSAPSEEELRLFVEAADRVEAEYGMDFGSPYVKVGDDNYEAKAIVRVHDGSLADVAGVRQWDLVDTVYPAPVDDPAALLDLEAGRKDSGSDVIRKILEFNGQPFYLVVARPTSGASITTSTVGKVIYFPGRTHE